MPSRSGRNPPIPLALGSGFTASPSNSSSLSTPENALRQPSQPQNAQTMASMNGSNPTSSYRGGHNRSVSHPFTSPFTGLGKKRGKDAPKHATWDSDSDSDDITYPAQPLQTSPRKDLPKGGSSHDLAEGKCQTCNSTVRWPRHLKVFRCTTCLMITDLDVEPARKVQDPADPNLEEWQDKPLPPDPTEHHAPPSLVHDLKPGTSMWIFGMFNGEKTLLTCH